MFFCTSFVWADFTDTMCGDWGSEHSNFHRDKDDAVLMLDQISGSGIQSKKLFVFGSFQMLMKLVPGNSAGTVTSYFLSSTTGEDKHDEIDFEFLGNVSGQPYVIHTNIYTDGAGGREQQFYPWFDPTQDYHNYTIHWNPSKVVWYVDSIPIRVYKNYPRDGIPYPHKQPMRVYSSIWNADSWATRGGLDKIQWEKAPFVARLRHFRPMACEYGGAGSISQCYNAPAAYIRLNDADKKRMTSVREKYMIYDYCKDNERYHGLFPGECLKEQS